MSYHHEPEVTPRNGHTLVVGIVARISGCANQKELSLEDQIDHAKQAVAELYSGPVEYREIATTGKGERLDRPELVAVEEMLRTRELDLLVCEDIGRMVRGTAAVALCGLAVDHGTRVLAPNDCIDTAEDNWEEDVIGACRDHVGHQSHTSKRIKHKKMNRFVKFGGATPCEIFGYIKLDGGFDLRLMPSVSDVSGIPTEGKNLIIAAVVDNGLYFRIFNGDGTMIVNTDEKRLTKQARPIEALRKLLESLWARHELTSRETGRVITAVTSIVGHTSEGDITYDDWRKDPEAEPIYKEWFRMLRETLNYSAVADLLNAKAVPTGPYCRKKKWDGYMVRRITANSLLKGMPGRGYMHTIKHHETGRRISVKNPNGPKYREYPHLAFVDPVEFDELNALLDAKNKGMGRKPSNGNDPRWRVPRKRTRFPGQHASCWYCGSQCVWGGNGRTHSLMCNGSREYRCWNSMAFDGPLAVEKIVAAITAELSRLEGFEDQFRELIEKARREGGSGLVQRWAELERAQKELARQQENTADAIAKYGTQPWIDKKVLEMRAKECELAAERWRLEHQGDRTLTLPGSVAELRQMLKEKFQVLASDSPEFGNILRQIVPDFHVFLVRACDGGHPLPRAHITLNLAGIIPDAKHAPGVAEVLTRQLTVDLFEPAQRERIREEAVRLAAQGLIRREIARRLPERVSQTMVGRALALDRMMRERGLDSPYVVVTEPPPDYPKLRRHKNSKYRFEPLDGYQQPSI